MTDPFLGEIRAFPYQFIPTGWALCDGSAISLQQNTALYSLLGNTFYGGDGTTTFALPNLVDRVAMGVGMAINMINDGLGYQYGSATETITQAQLSAHNHILQRKGHGTGTKTSAPASDSYFGQVLVDDPGGATQHTAESFITNAQPDTVMAPGIIGNSGGSQPHENQQPYVKLVYCIATQGIYPSR